MPFSFIGVGAKNVRGARESGGGGGRPSTPSGGETTATTTGGSLVSTGATSSCGQQDTSILNTVAHIWESVAQEKGGLSTRGFVMCTQPEHWWAAKGTDWRDNAIPTVNAAVGAANDLLGALNPKDINPADYRLIASNISLLWGGGNPPKATPKSSGPADDVEWLRVTADWIENTVFPKSDTLLSQAKDMERDANVGNILDFIDCGASGNKERFLAFYNSANNMPLVINELKPMVACLRNIAKNIEQLRIPSLSAIGRQLTQRGPIPPRLTFPLPTAAPQAPIDFGSIFKTPIDRGPIFKGPMHIGPLPTPSPSPDAPPGLAPLPAAGEETTATSSAGLTTATTRSQTSATNPFLTRTSATTPGASPPMETSTKVMIGVAALAVGGAGLFWWMNRPETAPGR